MTFIPLREKEGEVRMKEEPAKAERGGGRERARGRGENWWAAERGSGDLDKKKQRRKKKTDFLLAVLRRIRWVWLDNEQSTQKECEMERRRMDAGALE